MRIGIAAISSPPEREELERGLNVLRAAGHEVVLAANVFEREMYLSGSDEERCGRLVDLLRNDDIDVVTFARGGYGCQRIAGRLVREKFKSHKRIVGFSDQTPLLNMFARKGFDVYYGPDVTMLGIDAKTDKALLDVMSGKVVEGLPMKSAKVLKPGFCEGRVAGGCLILISSSVKTPYELDLDGSILFIEEINEKIYSLDRMITQLQNSGSLKNVRGIVCGGFVFPNDNGKGFESMLRDKFATFDGPVVVGLPFGHGHPFYPFPLGVDAKLKADEGSASLSFEGMR